MTTTTLEKPTTYSDLVDALHEARIIKPSEREPLFAATQDPENPLYPYAHNLLAFVAMLVNDSLETARWDYDFSVALATWRCAVELLP